MNAQTLIAESRRQRIGKAPAVIDLAYVEKVLTMLLNIVLKDGGNYEREPASMQAVVARSLATLLGYIGDVPVGIPLTGATMQTMDRTTERGSKLSVENLPHDLNLGREIDLAVTEWDPENPSLDPADHINPPAVPLLRTVRANRDGVRVLLGEAYNRAGDTSELQISIYTEEPYGGAALEGFLRREQLDAMIELLQAARMKAEAVFIPR